MTPPHDDPDALARELEQLQARVVLLETLRAEVAAAARDSMWYAREPRIMKALQALDEHA